MQILAGIKFYTSSDVCKILGITRSTIQSWLKTENSKFPKPVVISNKFLWRPEDIERFICETLRGEKYNTSNALADARIGDL